MKRSWLVPFVVFGVYLLIAVVITWPLLAHFSTAFAGFVYGDAYETAHHVWWFTEALRTGQSPFFQPLLAYPNGLEGVTLWADPLHFFPAWLFAFALPLPAAINLQTLLTLALNGLAMWALIKWLLDRPITPSPDTPLTLNPSPSGRGTSISDFSPLPEGEGPGVRADTQHWFLPAFIGGLVFMIFPAMQGHLGAGHTGLLVQWPLPLFVWALLRLDRHGWAAVLLAAALFMLGALGHTLQALYALGPLAALLILRFAWRREWRAAGRAALAVLLGGAALAVFGLPVFSATLGTGAYADEGGAVRYSADLLAVVTPSFFHPLFEGWEYAHRVLGINLDEGAAFVGFTGLFIGLLALWKAPRARFWWGVALVAWILSLGPLLKIFDQPALIPVDGGSSGIALPFAAVMNLPLVSLARTPGRFNFLLALAWAIILAYAVNWLVSALFARLGEQRGRIGAWALTLGLTAVLVFEFQTFWPLPLTTAEVPAAITALHERDDLRAVLDVPWNNLVAAKAGLYLQTEHRLPLIAGHVTRRTPVSPALLTILEDTLDPARLREAGADMVIVHREQDDGTLYQRAVNQLGAPIYEDERFAVFETPATDAPPTAATAGFHGGVISDRVEIYVYAPEDGWWSWAARLSADGRDAVLTLDDEPIGRWTLDGSQPVSVPLALTAGYHTLSLSVEPPCPAHVPAGQECRTLTVSDAALEPIPQFQPAAGADFRAPGESGVSLTLQSALPTSARPGENLRVPLVWSFETARTDTDIRFVHVLDESGVLVAQEDGPPGSIPAGESRAEWVSLALSPDLPPGDYRVYAGWYAYPDLVNFCVLADDACAGNELLLGVLRVE